MSTRVFTQAALRALLLLPFVAACSSPPTVLYTGPWLRPSPILKEKIDANARRMPWTHGLERVELVRWFAEVGEPAYPALLELCQDTRPDVAGAALGALGSTGDSRLVGELHGLPWPSEENVELRLERARALMRLGDFSMSVHMIGGLSHERLLVRALCSQSLYEATGKRFGFDPSASEADRVESIERWNEWWRVATTPAVELAQADPS